MEFCINTQCLLKSGTSIFVVLKKIHEQLSPLSNMPQEVPIAHERTLRHYARCWQKNDFCDEFASEPGCMDLSTILSLNSRSAMCIPSSYIFSTVLSNFSVAPEMQNEASRVCRSIDCKCCCSIILAGRTLGNLLGVPFFSSLDDKLSQSSWLEASIALCKVRRSGVPSTAGLWGEV